MQNHNFFYSFVKKPGILFLSLTAFTLSAFTQNVLVNVLTYNIRFANAGDAPNTWEARKQSVFSIVQSAKPDVFGLQEALNEQVTDFEKAFPGFNRIGVGRDDGKVSGEYSPLFFNSQKYTLLGSSTFWLSQTPLVAGSRGWDAACNRVVTWIQLKDNKSGIVFFIFCTHFDHMGEIARRNSSKLVLKAIDSISGDKQAVLLGDFNATPESEPYRIITERNNNNHLIDARTICGDPTGPIYTYTGFKVNGQPGERIDYIFLKGIARVNSFNVNPANNGEYYPSDHLPVNATVSLF
jgi:endonuclease/exonuclease/phosphatase family metal-dependent hydrolase